MTVSGVLQVLAAIRYWMAVLLVLSLPPAVGYWFIVHPFIRFWRRVGPRVTFWTLGVFYVGAMAALFPLRGLLLGRDLGFSLPLALLALPLLVISGIIARKRRKHLKFGILAGVPEVSPTAGPGLLTAGIYGTIRHPRYAEFILGLTGWALILNYLGFYLVTAVSLAMLYPIVLLEERELRERFGQAYADYAARVPRFIPRRTKSEG
jgi:protein-S-isoprenylcysteine O-methyltransferase Ste14